MPVQVQNSAISIGGVIPSTSERVLYANALSEAWWQSRATYEGTSWGTLAYNDSFYKSSIYAKDSNSVIFTSSDWGTLFRSYFIDIEGLVGTATQLQVRLLSALPSTVMTMNWKVQKESPFASSSNSSTSSFDFLPISTSGGSGGVFYLFNLNESSAKHIVVGFEGAGFDTVNTVKPRRLVGCSNAPQSSPAGIQFLCSSGTFTGRFTLYSMTNK